MYFKKLFRFFFAFADLKNTNLEAWEENDRRGAGSECHLVSFGLGMSSGLGELPKEVIF